MQHSDQTIIKEPYFFAVVPVIFLETDSKVNWIFF